MRSRLRRTLDCTVRSAFKVWCEGVLNFLFVDERVGNLTFVHSNVNDIPPVKSQVTLIVRGMYSNPPSHGARIVAYVLKNPQLYEQW